ncbi:hypothetical protein [Natronobeatus ordinarius]|uniref:hypothetical protein n=1 Tax=Natronobeatus ordinarius TaxID=2963433 RepID=UPI0020CE8BCD|nr:hypothetical protein [Natronobeatus ordinarius]
MKIKDLIDEEWESHERKRFLKDDTKVKTEAFDPESFKHEGFEDREKYLETYAPALADEERLALELNDFEPPRLGSINDSPYQALVIRYGLLRTLIQQRGYKMDKTALLESVQTWQRRLVDEYVEEDFSDDLLHLAKAAVDYGSDVDDSELHMVYSYFELHNEDQSQKHNYYTWMDFFKRLAAIDRFPKVSRSEKPEHAIDTIEKGLWSLQEQAIVYEVVDPKHGDVVGIPEEYVDFIREWLYYEMSEESFLTMLETLDYFDDQSRLVDARAHFGVTSATKGRNDLRRESLVNAGVYPSELLESMLTKNELKEIVDQYGLDAHKRRTGEMIQQTIEYFEQSQTDLVEDEVDAELYLNCFEDISDGNIQLIPPQLQETVDEADQSKKLEVLFEEATAEIFREVFNLDGTNLLGQQASGSVADGEIEQDGEWLLWDNKRRSGKFKLGANTQSTIKNYIDTKNQQHQVKWFVIIAPDFTETALTNANQLEKLVGGIDIRLIRSVDFVRLAEYWLENHDKDGRELPLSTFYGSDLFDVDTAKGALDMAFS